LHLILPFIDSTHLTQNSPFPVEAFYYILFQKIAANAYFHPMTLPLKNNFSLGMERYAKRIRLVIYKDAEEFVCRKEAFPALEKFTETTTDHLFRGRLQLHKDAGEIHIEVKGEILGSIPVNQFKGVLTLLKAPAH
jgi:hypothetical protein